MTFIERFVVSYMKRFHPDYAVSVDKHPARNAAIVVVNGRQIELSECRMILQDREHMLRDIAAKLDEAVK